MQKQFTPEEKALAQAEGGELLDAKTYTDKVVIVLVDGRKLTYTIEEAEAKLKQADEKAKAKAKAEKDAKAKAKG